MLRRLWRKLFGDPMDERYPSIHTPVEHVPSPVPWIDDPIWSRWVWKRQFVDIRDDVEWETLPEFRLFEASAADRARARVAPLPEGVSVPPTGTYEQHQALLRSTPPVPGVLCASWPICCGRLATLIHEQGTGVDINELEAHAGPLDQSYIEADLVEGEDRPRIIRDILALGYSSDLAIARRQGGTDGLLLHQCRACGRVYVGACHT